MLLTMYSSVRLFFLVFQSLISEILVVKFTKFVRETRLQVLVLAGIILTQSQPQFPPL